MRGNHPVSQFNDYEQYFDLGPITGLDLDCPTTNDWDVMIWTYSVLPTAKLPREAQAHK